MGSMAVTRVCTTDLGVRAFFPATGAAATVGALRVRVGHADETFADHGITRLALHLLATNAALADRCSIDVDHACASVAFWGDASEVLDQLRAFAAAIPAPQIDDLDVARAALLDHAQYGTPPDGSLEASVHFGAAGYGLGAYDELGALTCSPAEVLSWIRRHLVAANTAIWLDGSPGRGRVELPAGSRIPPPALRPVDRPTPRWCSLYPDGPPAVSLLVEAGPTGELARACAAERLRRSIQWHTKQVGGQSWGLPLDGTHDLVGLHGTNRVPLQGDPTHLVAAARSVADAGVSVRELRAAIDAEAVRFESAEAPDALAWHSAGDHLLGGSRPTGDAWLRAASKVTPDAVRRTWADALARAVWLLPAGSHAPVELVGPSDLALQAPPVTGETTVVDNETGTSIVVAADGCTKWLDDGRHETARFDALAGAVRWANGALTLVATDGDLLHLDLHDSNGGFEAADRVERSLADRYPSVVRIRVPFDPPGPAA